MNIFIAIFLLITGFVLFYLARKGRILGESIQLVTNIAGILAFLASLLVLFIPLQPQAEILTPITPTPTPRQIQNSPSVTQAILEPQKIDTEVTEGGISKSYFVILNDGEAIVGHADKFQEYRGCVAYLISGPGSYSFVVESGLWDKWTNLTPDLHEVLIREQSDTLTNKYSCIPVKTVICDITKCYTNTP